MGADSGSLRVPAQERRPDLPFGLPTLHASLGWERGKATETAGGTVTTFCTPLQSFASRDRISPRRKVKIPRRFAPYPRDLRRNCARPPLSKEK